MSATHACYKELQNTSLSDINLQDVHDIVRQSHLLHCPFVLSQKGVEGDSVILLSPLSLPVATCPPNHFVIRSTKTLFDDRGAQIKLEQPVCTSCATARRGSEVLCEYCKSKCVRLLD